jgi:hypothetical protein
VGKGKRADIYLEVRKRRGIYFLNETSACVMKPVFSHTNIFNFCFKYTSKHRKK